MGSYGFRISRIPAVVIEKSHDKDIIWPNQLCPFKVNFNKSLTKHRCSRFQFVDSLYDFLLTKNIEVLYDNRDESAGKKFADADLLGIPLKATIGKKYLDDNIQGVSLRLNRKREIN